MAVPLDKQVTGPNLAPVTKKIDELVAAGETTIVLRINSPGGSVDDGMKFIQHLENLNRRGIRTVCIADGNNISMAFAILQSSACQKRYATKRTYFLAHEPWFRVAGNQHDLRRFADDLGVSADGLAEMIGKRLKMGVKSYKKKVAVGDWIFGWREALRAGAIDGTIEPEQIPAVYTLEEPKSSLLEMLFGGAQIGPR